MRDGKAFASLTSGLLARKGQARPAMRAQGFGFAAGKLDDLGWNDMGHDAPHPDPTPLPVSPVRPQETDFEAAEGSPVIRQQAEIAEALAAPPVVEIVAEVALETPVAATAPAKTLPKAKRAKAIRAKAIRAEPAVAPLVAGRKAAFTLRIDADRHLRLRLACAVRNSSAQQIVTAALDRFLATLPDVERLATSLSATSGGPE